MNLGQTRIDPELIKLVVSLLAAFITAWIIIAQTDKKSRLFLLLVLAWVVFDSYEKWIDFQKGAPKPHLIISKINQKYDNVKKPSSATFNFVFKNVGNASAQKCLVQQNYFYDNKSEKEIHGSIPFDIDVDGTGEIPFHLGGSLFRRVWNEEISLSVKLKVNYYDLKNNEYLLEKQILYKPFSKQEGLNPAWTELGPMIN